MRAACHRATTVRGAAIPLITVALAAVTIVAASGVARACSMCQCGDPTYRLIGEEFFTATPWRMGFDIDHGGKDTAGDVEGTRETELETRMTVSGAWTPRPGLRLVGRLPFVNRKIEATDGTSTMFGLSDPELFVHAQVTPTKARNWAALMVGVRAPWGQNDRTVDGERADEHLQPGTGAGSIWAGASGALRLGKREHLFSSVMARWNGTNHHGYHYGNAAFLNLAYQHDLAPRLAGVLEANARDARFDEVDGTQAPNTGGSVLYLAPRVQWQMNETLVLRLGVQVPVAQRMIGDQRERANLITGITLAY
jgi:Putative MetA-pathway of phenol degradation